MRRQRLMRAVVWVVVAGMVLSLVAALVPLLR